MGFAEITNVVLEFVREHPNWAAFVVFALAFGESLPFISLILPFWAVLVGIGTIIAVADPLIFWTIVAAAAIGAALGDWLSYWVGFHYHAQIQQMWPLKNHPSFWTKVVHSSSAGVVGGSSSPVSLGRYAQASLSWQALPKCRGCGSRLQIGAQPFFGPSCCYRPALGE